MSAQGLLVMAVACTLGYLLAGVIGLLVALLLCLLLFATGVGV